MAGAAIRCGKRRAGRRVRRIIGLLPLGQVTAGIAAIRWRGRQIVVVVDVARSARHIRVASGQQETRLAMIKRGAQPGIECGVASLALVGIEEG